MKKIIEDVVAKEKKGNMEGKITKKSNPQKNDKLKDSLTRQTISRGIQDKELEEVLSGLTTTIKVIGCGGAGTNTISRCVASQISGAELIAINTDAQHLLITESPNKVLNW